MEIRAVAFDLFGTLMYIENRLTPYRDLCRALAVDYRQGKEVVLTRDLDLQDMIAALAPDHNVDIAFYEDCIRREVASIRLYEDSLPTLQELNALGLKTCAVSNLSRPYAPGYHRLLGEVLPRHVFSYEVGAAKPDARIFLRACALLDEAPERVLMVGDSQRADLQGALECGLQAVLLRREAENADDQCLTRLSDLAAYCQGLYAR